VKATPPGDAADGRRALLRAESDQLLFQRYARERSQLVREELIRRFMPLARSLALRYRRQTESLDDLVQVAGLGLVKAVDGFDPDRGKGFHAYAVPTILGELRRHFRDHVWTIRLPRGLGELTMNVDRATTDLTEGLGRFPTAAELSSHLEVSVEDVLDAIEAGHARRTMSLDAPKRPDDEDAGTAIEALPVAELGYERVEADLASQTADLDEREWEVLRMRFVDELTQSEIAAGLGVSQMQISRISRRALWKLLSAVRGEEEDGPVPPSGSRETVDPLDP
jgi:RNA polymerase sigma-B factor